MAIVTEFIDFIVPISVIEKKYPGGWKQCQEDYAENFGHRVWHDEYLFRDGAMSPMDIQLLIQEWTNLGFECYEDLDGEMRWKDVCVFEGLFGGPTMPCEWLAFDRKTRTVYFKGTEPGELAGPFLRE